ncbi:AAA family ATPase [Denitromonas iodatirespirans]|uniref:AAA family ATPase n=1 Tax=Denitromonas iodatirespirans TaxID=2795389 RepID=A0A944D667_DENI1|nr:AAA family ATPase [Denitromonas iodatirespirans]MBT0960659.1 AAA family ATPase [Denitromonas iodatirespirans]
MSSLPVRPSLAARLRRMLERLSDGLVERDALARQVFLAALAGEHSLLIGPPGTAKSALARRLHRAFAEGGYFERLLTRFSVPEELFGPLSISALEQDRYERHTAGFLPEAHIAFIDEVFKANSAILNALLTLLNEREFDNGAGRMRCPLVSVIGATNAVPDDAVADAFFDRFLMRIVVSPVSAAGFGRLLQAAPDDQGAPFPEALLATERQALAQAAQAVTLPSPVMDCLRDLRSALAQMEIVVSDRRWVKMVALLKTAAATEGRSAVSCWDVSLLPVCIATEAEEQAQVAAWLASRLGVREAISPPRLTRIVEAFEAQLGAEQKANDLDYDADGRLRFSAGELAHEIGDAKGGAEALRMTYQRRRRYGAAHIDARTAQVSALLERIERYRREVLAQIDDLTQYLDQSLWMAPDFAVAAHTHLRDTVAAIDALRERAVSAREGFVALPRLPEGAGSVPEPVAHEAWPD